MQAKDLRAVADRLSTLGSIRRVVSRPSTSSLIVEFDGPAAPVMSAIRASGLARLGDKSPPPQIGMVARLALLRAETRVRTATDGALDLYTLLGLMLLMGAAIQVGRGRIASPATSLAMAALTMLDRSWRDSPSAK
jgi:hypothetical protein